MKVIIRKDFLCVDILSLRAWISLEPLCPDHEGKLRYFNLVDSIELEAEWDNEDTEYVFDNEGSRFLLFEGCGV